MLRRRRATLWRKNLQVSGWQRTVIKISWLVVSTSVQIQQEHLKLKSKVSLSVQRFNKLLLASLIFLEMCSRLVILLTEIIDRLLEAIQKACLQRKVLHCFMFKKSLEMEGGMLASSQVSLSLLDWVTEVLSDLKVSAKNTVGYEWWPTHRLEWSGLADNFRFQEWPIMHSIIALATDLGSNWTVSKMLILKLPGVHRNSFRE